MVLRQGFSTTSEIVSNTLAETTIPWNELIWGEKLHAANLR